MLSIQTWIDASNRWVMVDVEIRGRDGSAIVAMALDTGSPISTLSIGMHRALAQRGLVEAIPGAKNRYLLHNVSIQDQPIADLEVRVSLQATRARVLGTLGLNFLMRYDDVRFHVPSLMLTLTP